MDHYKEILGVLGIAMAIGSYVPYLVAIYKKTNKPHIFSWTIWTLLSAIVSVGQVVGGAGPGAWTQIATTAICVFIVIATLRIGEKDIKKSDVYLFLATLMSIPLWVVTKDPLWSMWLLVIIDVFAFFPTFRKSWNKPWEENSFMYGLNVPRHMIGFFALENITMTTALFPIAMVIINGAMYLSLKFRRVYLSKTLSR